MKVANIGGNWNLNVLSKDISLVHQIETFGEAYQET